MNRYLEYNLINNIPILYPDAAQKNFRYVPRYKIADADRLLHCFDRYKEGIEIQGVKFRYIRVHLNKTFKTLGNAVKALYYYVIVENSIDYDGFDTKDVKKIMKWLKDTHNHYVIITTPILQYQHEYYSVCNNNDISICKHNPNDLMNDKQMILKLIDNCCYTICDNYNIVISLYHQQLIDKRSFMYMINMLNQLRNFYYTPVIWLNLMNHHRIMLACDFPILYLVSQPELVEKDIFDIFGIMSLNEQNIYLQTCYCNNVLYSSLISTSYPSTNLELATTLLGNVKKMWSIPKCKDFDGYINKDYYGLFAVFLNNMWTYWCSNKKTIITDILAQHNDNFCIIFDILCSLFVLYNDGYEDIKIQKSRVRQIWNEILYYTDSIESVVNYFVILKDINIPYVFLFDIYNVRSIDWGRRQLMFDNDHIYKYTNLYTLLCERSVKDNLYYFHQNVCKKRVIYILMCIYRKFQMFKADRALSHTYTKGVLLIEFLKYHMYYLC